jgi:hypothetical protein
MQKNRTRLRRSGVLLLPILACRIAVGRWPGRAKGANVLLGGRESLHPKTGWVVVW